MNDVSVAKYIDAFPIRTVSALTGINPITLRTWERRYHLIEPVRTPKGHRLYTKEHIAMLSRVVELLDRGIPISRITYAAITEDSASAVTQEQLFWRRMIDRMIVAIGKFNESVLENTYNEAMALYPIETVTQRLLLPMLEKLGRRWESGEGTIAEEHFFGVYLRNKLGARFHHKKRLENAPAFITACIPGERHEIGLLLFALSAYDHGYRCILLGADIPLSELPKALVQSGSNGIVLSASLIEDPAAFEHDLSQLVKNSAAPVFIGGFGSLVHKDLIEKAG
ncbi:MAG: MerR family transcriptional regulator, partial [Nitrosomonadales bacterium]|nr:MerR family transcriptional regulator [Nitrosomonadales bacterium]